MIFYQETIDLDGAISELNKILNTIKSISKNQID